MTLTRWSKYGPCETCDAEPGHPCRDLRFAATRDRTSHVLPNARPHRGRRVRGSLPPRRGGHP